jgi:hypothetical protein
MPAAKHKSLPRDWRGIQYVKVTLGTGYSVPVKVPRLEDDFHHLSQAMVMEHVFSTLKATNGSWNEALAALATGTHEAIAGLAEKDCRALASWLLHRLCMNKLEEIVEHLRKDARKQGHRRGGRTKRSRG